MNRQEFFNEAYLGLINQMKQSRHEDNDKICLYRGPNGLKCAIGHALPDSDLFNTIACNMNSYNYADVSDPKILKMIEENYGSVSWTEREFCEKLQKVHEELENLHGMFDK